MHEGAGCPHRPHGVGGGGTNPDGKQVEDTDHDVLRLWISSKHCKFFVVDEKGGSSGV
ncbi:hypothetical protein B224_2136 [Aeromonas media WS]|nr:hypothetical protein B224_2136 [Aeromonas media WS]